MLEKFQQQSKLVRVLLLIIPFVNWIVEIVIRWERYMQKKDTASLLIAIIATIFFGNLLGFVDAIFTILNDKISLLDLEVK